MKAFFSRSSCLSRQSISDYVDGRLSAEARFEVENHLLDCALCRAAVDGYALTREEAPNIPVGSLPRKKPRRRTVLLLLVIIAGMAAAIWYAQYQKNQETQTLYLRYFAPPANVYLAQPPRTGEELAFPQRTRAMSYYDEGRYAAALPLFESYLIRQPSDATTRFYFGIAQLALHQTQQAIETLSTAAEQLPDRQTEINWYLALAFLQNGDVVTAKKILRPLLETPGAYQQRTEDLLRDLESLD